MEESDLASMRDQLRVRRASTRDILFFLRVRNAEASIRWSKSPHRVPFTVHFFWMLRALNSRQHKLWVAQLCGSQRRESSRVGIIRFEAAQSGAWEVSVALHPEFHGQGFGLRILQIGLSKMRDWLDYQPVRFTATVHVNNIASSKIFKRVGFKQMDSGGDFIVLEIN